MNCRKLILGFVVFIFLSSNVHASGPFSSLVEGESEWIYAAAKKADQDILAYIEEDVNEAFRTEVVAPLLENAISTLGSNLDEESVEVLLEYVPYIQIATLFLDSGGPSESQVMLQTILTAMGHVKQDIVNSVGENYEDDTESRLNALLLELDVYNSRSESSRMQAYGTLSNLSYQASLVKQRLAQRSDTMVRNSHLYLLASTLHFEIQREYTQWLELDVDPSVSDGEIQDEVDSVFGEILRDNSDVIQTGALSKLSVWRDAFERSFSSPSEIEFSHEESAEYEVCRSTRFGIRCTMEPARAWFFTYEVGGRDVEFKTIFPDHRVYRVPPYVTVYNAEGEVSDGFRSSVSVSSMLGKIRESGAPIEDHMNDSESFVKYLEEGYGPIARLMDTWWQAHYGVNRPASEVDDFLDEN